MKNTKKALALFLGILIIITAFPIGALAKGKAPAKPTSLSFTSTSASITLKWKKVRSANGYKVYLYNGKTKKYYELKTVSKNSFKMKNIKSASTYVYAVKSYKSINGKKYYSPYSSKLRATTLPLKVTGFKVLGRNVSNVALSWKKVSGANGYKIDYTTDKSFKNNVKSKKVTGVKATLSSLSNSKYYLRISAYKTLNKKAYYSAVSSVITSAAVNKNTI